MGAAAAPPASYGTAWQAMGAQDLPPGVRPDDFRAVKGHVAALVAARTRLQEAAQRERVLLSRARSDAAAARRVLAMLRAEPSPLVNLARARLSALGASAGELLPQGGSGGAAGSGASAGSAGSAGGAIGLRGGGGGSVSSVLDAHTSLLAAFAGIVPPSSSSILSAGGSGSAGGSAGGGGTISADPSAVLLSGGPAAVSDLKHRVLEAQARLLLVLAQRQRRVVDAGAAARRGADEAEALRTEVAALRGRAAALRERLQRQAALAAHGFAGTATSALWAAGASASTAAAAAGGPLGASAGGSLGASGHGGGGGGGFAYPSFSAGGGGAGGGGGGFTYPGVGAL